MHVRTHAYLQIDIFLIVKQSSTGENNKSGEGGIRTRGTRKRTHAFQACSLSHSDTSPIIVIECSAEGEGFEPPKGVNPCRFSRPVHSTALPPLQRHYADDLSDVSSSASAILSGFSSEVVISSGSSNVGISMS